MRSRDSLLILATALWLGMLIGVSFLATPVKFQAPSLDLPTALEVGRVTFALFNRVEWIAAALLAGAVLLAGERRLVLIAAVVLIAALALQTFWVLPDLDARIGMVIAGTTPPPSHQHLLYVALEAGKTIMLAALAAGLVLRAGRARARAEG